MKKNVELVDLKGAKKVSELKVGSPFFYLI
jgi:hypothetical protein